MKTLLKNRELSAFLAIVVLFAGLVTLNRPISAYRPWA